MVCALSIAASVRRENDWRNGIDHTILVAIEQKLAAITFFTATWGESLFWWIGVVEDCAKYFLGWTISKP